MLESKHIKMLTQNLRLIDLSMVIFFVYFLSTSTLFMNDYEIELNSLN